MADPFTQQKERKILALRSRKGSSPILELNVEDPRRQPGPTRIAICPKERPRKELDSIQSSKDMQFPSRDLRLSRYVYDAYEVFARFRRDRNAEHVRAMHSRTSLISKDGALQAFTRPISRSSLRSSGTNKMLLSKGVGA